MVRRRIGKIKKMQPKIKKMNILTFDIEEWYAYNQPQRWSEFDWYLDTILDKLDERQLKGTFFCVGEMGRLFPNVIKKIYARGHEVGCHSNIHTWLNKMTEEECREDTQCAVNSLEQCIGEKVKSYRAPAFSIGERNKWAFEILVENGIERDASVFPAARDFGGFPSFGQDKPCIIEYNGIRIKEFPICTTNIMGREVAYSGGGYFRFFPLSFVRHKMIQNPYAMGYFHIGDLLPETSGVLSKQDYEAYFKEPGTIKARYMRYVKTNLGKKKALGKLIKLMSSVEFVNLEQAENLIDWEKVPVVNFNQ